MGAVASFDFNEWIALYPEFAGRVDAVRGGYYFDQATVLWRNDGTGPVSKTNTQKMLLYVLTAHLAQLFGPAKAGGSPSSETLVGRIRSASEGTVSVEAEYSTTTTPTQAWYVQTKYGAEFWAMTAQYRNMRYCPGPTRQFAPWPYGWPGRFGG